MEHISTNIIETQRIKRELLSMKYIEEIYKEFTDNVTKTLRTSTPKSLEDEKNRVIRSQAQYDEWTSMELVVTDKEDNFIWCCSIMRLDTSTPEVWLRLKQSARGQWYGKEMIDGLIQRIEKNKTFDYIVYRAKTDNIATRKIAESFGWILQIDEQGKEKIFIENKYDNTSSFEAVEYRIYKK